MRSGPGEPIDDGQGISKGLSRSRRSGDAEVVSGAEAACKLLPHCSLDREELLEPELWEAVRGRQCRT